MITREVLNATGMSLSIFCAGQATVGIGVTGTWAGTLSFYGSTDGINFFALSVTPFASGTNVSTATANGNWFVNAQNLMVVKVEFTRTSGSATVIMSSSTDASWQNAFLTSAEQNNTSSATGGTNTMTQAAQANRAWNLKSLLVSVSGPTWPGGTMRLRVFDGTITGTALFSTFLTETGGSVGRYYDIDLPEGGITNTPGNAMTIQLLGPTATNASEINASFSAG